MCNEMLFVDRRWAISSGIENPSGFVRFIEEGSMVGSVRSVSVSQAMKSKTQRTEPARALITSGRMLVETLLNFNNQLTWVVKRR